MYPAGATPSVAEQVAPAENPTTVATNGEASVATPDGGNVMRFDIDTFRKYCLVNGLDDIGLTLRHTDKIRAFEERRRSEQPWLFG